jgi:putative salt-induced outer membrane protein YdiY
MSKFNSLSFVVAMACAGTLSSQPAFSAEQDGWAGEAAFSAGYTTGNTETTDLGLGVDVKRTQGLWTVELVADGDYGEQDGIESRNRYFLSGDVDRLLNEKLFAFARTSYEVDQFTGFDSRSFVGGGLGYHIYDSDTTKWTLRGGPGVKIDEVKRVITTDALGGALIIPAETETSLGAVARSEYAYKFNENVSFSNETDVLYGETSTQLENSAALTAAISNAISARMSFNVRYDTNPADGFEDTDTALKIALVYGFGG